MTSPETEPFAKGPVAQKINNAIQTAGATLKNAGQKVKNKVNEFGAGWREADKIMNDSKGSGYLPNISRGGNMSGDDGRTQTEATGSNINIDVNKTLSGVGKFVDKAEEAIKHPLETREQVNKPGTSHFENPNTGKKETQAMQTALDPNLKDKDGRSVLGDRERRETSPGEYATLYGTGEAGKKTITALGRVPNEPKQGAGKALDLLNMGADLSTAVERGLKTMRSTVNVAMSPQMTGANVGAAFVSHVTGLLDATSQSLSEIGKDMDASVKRRTAEYGQRMKAQFAYMLDCICTDASGKKKTLDQLDADDIERLYDSMHNVWGREAEAVTEGLSPELAAGVKKAYGKALTDLGRYASEAKARTVTAKQEAKLVRDKKVSDAKEKLHGDIRQWLDDHKDDIRAKGVERAIASGKDPTEAVRMMVYDVPGFANAAVKDIESEISAMRDSIPQLDKERDILDDEVSKARVKLRQYTEFSKKSMNSDEINNIASLEQNYLSHSQKPYHSALFDYIDKYKKRDMFDVTKYNPVINKFNDLNKEKQEYLNLRNYERTDTKYKSKIGDINAIGDSLYYGVDNDWRSKPWLYDAAAYLSGKQTDLKKVKEVIRRGGTIFTAVRKLFSIPAKKEFMGAIQNELVSSVPAMLGCDELKDSVAKHIWAKNNRSKLEKLAKIYDDEIAKNGGKESPYADRGAFSDDFINWVGSNGKDAGNGDHIYGTGDGEYIIITPYDRGTYLKVIDNAIKDGTYGQMVWGASDYILNEMCDVDSEFNKNFSKLPQEIVNFVHMNSVVSVMQAYDKIQKMLGEADKKGYTSLINLNEFMKPEEWQELIGRTRTWVGAGKNTLNSAMNSINAKIVFDSLTEALDNRMAKCRKEGLNENTDKTCNKISETILKLSENICNSTGIENPFKESLYTKYGVIMAEQGNNNATFTDFAKLQVANYKAIVEQSQILSAFSAAKGTNIHKPDLKIDLTDTNEIKNLAAYVSYITGQDVQSGGSWGNILKNDNIKLIKDILKKINKDFKKTNASNEDLFRALKGLYQHIGTTYASKNYKKTNKNNPNPSFTQNFENLCNVIYTVMDNIKKDIGKQNKAIVLPKRIKP